MSDIHERIAALPPEKRNLLLRQLRQKGGRSVRPPVTPRPREADSFPLSFAQQRLWFLDQIVPDSPAYNLATAVRMEGPLEVSILARGLEALVRRHESLRTVFRDGEGGAVQVIVPPAPLELPVHDVSSPPADARKERMEGLIREEVRRPFDLTRGPLLRASVLKVGEREHVLLLVLHHIIADGWSLRVLVDEVVALYGAFAEGREAELPPLAVQVVDHALWQREWLRGEALESRLSYWHEQLQGTPPVLALPTDRPRPARQGFRGARCSRLLPRSLYERLEALARSEEVTLLMVLMAGFQVLLARHSGQDDILVGTPAPGRHSRELEGLIGPFVNTLVVRTKLEGGPSFRELLKRVRTVVQEAQANQDVPFEKLVEELRPAGSSSHSPLFQVGLELREAPEVRPLSGFKLEPVELEAWTAKLDLELSCEVRPEGLLASMTYSTDLFDAASVERMLGHLEVLLAAAAEEPERKVSELPLLTERERERLLVEWNATRRELPGGGSIPEELERQVRLRGEAVAVECGEEKLTYRQLEERANQLAHYLRKKGVGPEERVGLCLERSVELVVALVGIVKAGGAYVPLEVEYPRERLASMLGEAKPRVVVTRRTLVERLPVEGVECVVWEELEGALEKEPKHAPASGVEGRNVAYIDFTSGSTGKPKGVCTEHRGVLRTVKGAEYAHLGPEETFLLIAPVAFDASTLEIWGCLLNGARLVVYPPQVVGDVGELRRVLHQHGVTTLHLTAGLFTQVVDLEPEALRGVRQLLTGGDVVSAPHVKRVLEALKVPVTACYGPTENTLFTSCHRMETVEQVGEVVPIGRPIGNTSVYVLDRHQQPVPVGVVGELYTGGLGVARGYLESPELTAERFVPDPFSRVGGERMYRTGDLARWREDGVLEFLGRRDSQVKVRGFRIELGEVEGALRAHPEVGECVVVVREERAGDKRLVGYVVPSPGQTLEAQALRSFLRGRLPEYMVPSAFVVLGALPLTSNGKVDRKALPAPDDSATRRGARFVETGNPLEQQLAAIWAKELGLERVGVHEHFFEELGGNSLLAIRVVHHMREALRRELPVRMLFEHSTIHALAQQLAREEEAPQVAPSRSARERVQGRNQVLQRLQSRGKNGNGNG